MKNIWSIAKRMEDYGSLNLIWHGYICQQSLEEPFACLYGSLIVSPIFMSETLIKIEQKESTVTVKCILSPWRFSGSLLKILEDVLFSEQFCIL